MKFTSLIFWQSIVLIFSECFCSPNPNDLLPEWRPAREIRPSLKIDDSFVAVEDRNNLVSELKHLGTDYMRSLKSMENILTEMQDQWQHIENKSKALKRNMGHLLTDAKLCNNDEESEFGNEDYFFSKSKNWQKEAIKKLSTGIKDIWKTLDNTSWHAWPVPNGEIPALRSQVAGLLYLLKERPCESSTETFYNGRCHPIGQDEQCPHNSLMMLYDGPNNKGFCDCQDSIRGGNGLLPIFSDESGKCHFQYTQGPCSRGEWFVITNGVPQCETVPNRCFADGKHVYGKMTGKEGETTLNILRGRSRSSSSTESKCWEIGSSAHCAPEQSVQAEQNSEGDLRIYCSFPVSEVALPISLTYFTPCRPGTQRNRHRICHRRFIG